MLKMKTKRFKNGLASSEDFYSTIKFQPLLEREMHFGPIWLLRNVETHSGEKLNIRNIDLVFGRVLLGPEDVVKSS